MPSPVSSERNTSPVVWLVNKGGHDYTDLDNYGRVIALTSNNVNPFNPDRLMVLIGQHFTMAKPEDYIAISGLPILNVLAVNMWLAKFPQANLLQHSVKKGAYVYLRITRAAIAQNVAAESGE